MKKNNRIPSYKFIWCKIRYWQKLHEYSDTELGGMMDVNDRTVREYDKNCKNITLEQLDNFLYINNMELSDLMSL